MTFPGMLGMENVYQVLLLFISFEKGHYDVPGQFNPCKICQPDVFMFSVLCI